MKNRKKQLSKMELLIHLIVKVKKDDIFALASQLAYYLVLSFFPFLIFLSTLLIAINIDVSYMLEILKNILPTSVFSVCKSIVAEEVSATRTGLMGISILVLIWTSSSGFRAVIKAINKAYNLCEETSLIRKTIVAYISTFALGITILIALIIFVFGGVIGKYLIAAVPFKDATLIIWNLLRSGVLLIIIIFVFAAIYRYVPCKRLKWREVFPGAVFSSLGWVVVSIVFSYYINNFNNYSRFYGSLSAVFILMIWLFLTAIIFLLGVEINAVLFLREDTDSIR